jgi:hypothetical protein
VTDRFLERAKTRDPVLEQSIFSLLESDARDNSWAQLVNNPDMARDVATEETRPFREYMVNESVQQFRDYYEDDESTVSFFELLDNLTNRDKIRFMEIFEDPTVDQQDYKQFYMIQKREYNPELSIFSNMVLDLVDFKDRIRPLSKDISMLESATKYQKENVEKMQTKNAEFRQLLNEVVNDGDDRIESEGYSSVEISEPKTEAVEEAAAEEAVVEEAEEAAEEAPEEEKK